MPPLITSLAQISADTAVGESRVQDIGGDMRLDESFNLASKLADFRQILIKISPIIQQGKIKSKVKLLSLVR